MKYLECNCDLVDEINGECLKCANIFEGVVCITQILRNLPRYGKQNRSKKPSLKMAQEE